MAQNSFLKVTQKQIFLAVVSNVLCLEEKEMLLWGHGQGNSQQLEKRATPSEVLYIVKNHNPLRK